MVIIGGRPSQGKTSLALQWAEHIGRNHGRKTLFVSLEMSATSLTDRLLALRTGIDGYKIHGPGRPSESDRPKIEHAIREYCELNSIIFDDSPSRTASEIAATARRLKAKDDIATVFVDYVQLIDTSKDARSKQRHEEVANVCRRMKTMARELNIPVILLAQLNRASESRDGNRPRLADLKESGQLEQDASQVILVHRPEFYDPNESPGIAELIVAKNRDGNTGTVKVGFQKHITKFVNLTFDPTTADF